MIKQPEALKLADELAFTGVIECVLASEHIRRLHATNVELIEALVDVRRALEVANFTGELAVVNAAIKKHGGQS